MGLKALAEIVIDVAGIPGGATIFKVLCLVGQLVGEVQDGKTTCVELHERLELLFEELQRIETSGGLQSKAVDKFVKTLEEYWRHLDAYNEMNFAERLFRHSKLRKAIESINKNVDELVKMVGIVNARLIVEWRKQYEADMAEQHERLMDISRSAAEVRGDLRDKQEMTDAVVLLKDALQKVNNHELTLDDDVQAAVRRTLKAITFDSQELDDVTPPDWFINENEVDFDEVPFARGSFATVHRGKYHEHTPVVVKMLLPGKGGLDLTLQEAFANEVEVWKRLNHPHVARLLGACHVSSRPFLVCDDATNGSMGEFLDRSADRRAMWRLLYETAQGLSHLHSKKVIHGDIRLANILVTKAESALLTDFGLSRVKDKDKSISKSMTARKDGEPAIEGTWRWMAPEGFDFKPQFESDVYSLAMCILEAFVGLPPYATVNDEDQVKELILAGKLPAQPAGMSVKVWTLIERMTKKERKDRMPLEDVIKFLGELAESEAAPPSTGRETVPAADTDLGTSDLQLLLEQLQNGDVWAAEQLTRLSKNPATAPQFQSSRIIHRLVTALEDATSAQLKEHVSSVLTNVAHQNGASLIGSRGGIVPLVELLTSQHEQLRRSGLTALTPLLKDPMNAGMFCQARGVEALQAHLSGGAGVEALKQLGKIVASGSPALAEAVASNKELLQFCLDHVKKASTEQRDAAARVLVELAQKHGAAVLSIDRLGGFEVVAGVGGTATNGILVAAIKTLLRQVYGERQPEVPKA